MVRQAQSWIPAPCWVVIAHDVNGHLNVLADAGLVPSLGPSLWSAANWVMRHGAEFFSGDLAKDSRGGPGAGGSAIALPLTCRNRSVGALVCLDPQPSRTTPTMGPSLVMSLRLLLEPSAIALDNALALQRAEALSVTDELTRLSNSRYLNQVLRRETKRSVRNGSPLSLLFLDLDSFKQVNDQHGHLAGSKVLMEAAAVIRGCARETDVVARFGGDEFTLLLPDTNTEGAVQVAERIRDRLRASRFLTSDGIVCPSDGLDRCRHASTRQAPYRRRTDESGRHGHVPRQGRRQGRYLCRSRRAVACRPARLPSLLPDFARGSGAVGLAQEGS